MAFFVYTLMKNSDHQEVYEILATQYAEEIKAIAPKRYVSPENGCEYISHKELVTRDVENLISAGETLRHTRTLDEGKQLTTLNLAQLLHYGRQTYYLNPELGEALLRTEPPNEVPTSEIKWPFPAFRVILPRNWFPLGDYTIDFVDIAFHPTGPSTLLPQVLTDAFLRREVQVLVAKDNIVITTSTKTSTSGRESFFINRPWADSTIADIRKNFDTTSATINLSDKEHRDSERLLLLTVNILMLLHSVPEETTPEAQERGEKKHNGKVIREALWKPRIIGRKSFSNERDGSESASTGKVQSAHWRCGHWKRQPHGPDKALRKTIWIKPYRTHREET